MAEGNIDGLLLVEDVVDGRSVHIDNGKPQGPDGSDVNSLVFNPTNSNSKYGPCPEGCSLEA